MSVSPPKRIARQSKRENDLEQTEQDGTELQWQALGRESRGKGSNFDAS